MSTKAKSSRQDIDAIADSVLEKQRTYFEPRLAQIQQVGKDNDEKLGAIQAELATLTAGLGIIKSDVNALKTAVGSNTSTLDSHSQVLYAMERKLADMEDRNRRCNIRITGLEEGLEGSSATQFLAHSLPKWFLLLAASRLRL